MAKFIPWNRSHFAWPYFLLDSYFSYWKKAWLYKQSHFKKSWQYMAIYSMYGKSFQQGLEIILKLRKKRNFAIYPWSNYLIFMTRILREGMFAYFQGHIKLIISLSTLIIRKEKIFVLKYWTQYQTQWKDRTKIQFSGPSFLPLLPR